ncbi:hypothetical protein BLSTO_01252 [Blastocystis sp. subtype 1]
MCCVSKCVSSIREHNTQSPADNQISSFPLRIVVNENGLEEREDDFNKDFVLNMLKKIDWNAFRSGATDIGYQIPEQIPAELTDEVLHQIHHALLELDVISGKLVCPHCGREYIIEQGIPNMLLREDEV